MQTLEKNIELIILRQCSREVGGRKKHRCACFALRANPGADSRKEAATRMNIEALAVPDDLAIWPAFGVRGDARI